MGLFAGLVRPLATAGRNALDDYWYTSIGQTSVTGIRVDGDTAMKTSAVWGCVRLIAETIAQVPLPVYQRRPDGGRERATGYYLYSILHDQPNRWQTSMEFREMLTGHALLRGNGYARIVSGRRGFADQLIPLHPDRVTPVQADDGTITYAVRQTDGRTVVYADEDIFHLRGLSSDGLRGLSVLEYARDSIGLALAAESYGARVFSQDARPGGVLEHPGKLSDEGRLRLKKNWDAAHAGLNKAHGTAVLEEGMKWQQIAMTAEDAQLLGTRGFQIADIARWFRVPLHMIQETTGSTSWGSGLEQLSLAFLIYTLLPWARRWEGAIARDLIVQTGTYYAEHLFDSLLRGDQKSRYEAYAIGRNWGWLSANDIRRRENDDPIEGGDIYLQAANMNPVGTLPPPLPAPTAIAEPVPPPPAEPSGQNAHYWLLLHETAGRIVRKEIAAMSKAVTRCGGDTAAWESAVDEFYAEHATYVAQTLRIPCQVAEAYAAQQRAALRQYGAAVLQDWEIDGAGNLLALVGGEPCTTYDTATS